MKIPRSKTIIQAPYRLVMITKLPSATFIIGRMLWLYFCCHSHIKQSMVVYPTTRNAWEKNCHGEQSSRRISGIAIVSNIQLSLSSWVVFARRKVINNSAVLRHWQESDPPTPYRSSHGGLWDGSWCLLDIIGPLDELVLLLRLSSQLSVGAYSINLTNVPNMFYNPESSALVWLSCTRWDGLTAVVMIHHFTHDL